MPQGSPWYAQDRPAVLLPKARPPLRPSFGLPKPPDFVKPECPPPFRPQQLNRAFRASSAPGITACPGRQKRPALYPGADQAIEGRFFNYFRAAAKGCRDPFGGRGALFVQGRNKTENSASTARTAGARRQEHRCAAVSTASACPQARRGCSGGRCRLRSFASVPPGRGWFGSAFPGAKAAPAGLAGAPPAQPERQPACKPEPQKTVFHRLARRSPAPRPGPIQFQRRTQRSKRPFSAGRSCPSRSLSAVHPAPPARLSSRDGGKQGKTPISFPPRPSFPPARVLPSSRESRVTTAQSAPQRFRTRPVCRGLPRKGIDLYKNNPKGRVHRFFNLSRPWAKAPESVEKPAPRTPARFRPGGSPRSKYPL